MRILDFQPGAYRNLPPRAIHFDRQPEAAPPEDGCSIRFLVGKNGTGKTNILRFLAGIFLAIEEDYRRPRANSPAYTVPYRLSYELRGAKIEIDSSGEGRSGVTFTIDGEAREPGEIPARDRILPSVLVYTSGDHRDWQALFQSGASEDEEEQAQGEKDTLRRDEEQPPDRALPAPQAEPEASDSPPPAPVSTGETLPENDPEAAAQNANRRVNLASASQLKFALLAALLDHQYHERETSALRDALDEVNVRLVAFSLELHKPFDSPYYSGRLEALSKIATRRIRQWEEELWVYDLDEIDALNGHKRIEQVAESQPSFNFYQMLCNLQAQTILLSANLIIEYRPHPQTGQPKRILLSDELSDGEFAFISRMALISLLNEPECLFLLDEPEVHFNDDWKRNLVDSIERALTLPEKTNSEVILTSHASIVLTDAYPDEVILMTYAGQEDNIPLTFAAEQGEALRAIFGSERSVGRRAMKEVDAVIKDGSVEDLEALLEKVGPGYYRFKIVRELQRRVPPDQQDQLSAPQ